MLEFQTTPEFSYENPSSLSPFCVSFRDNIHARITLILCNGFVVLGGKQVKMFRWGNLYFGFGVFLFVLFCFSFKNLTSIDLPESLDRFLVLDILKMKNDGVYVSCSKFLFPVYFSM